MTTTSSFPRLDSKIYSEAEYIHGHKKIVIDSSITSAILSVAKTSQLTLNTMIIGAWALVIHHYTNLIDLVFGVTVSGRPTDLEGSESVIGNCINTIPLRASYQKSITTLKFLQQLQQSQTEISSYSYLALSEIKECSQVASLQLFESIVVFENETIDGSKVNQILY